MWRLNWLLAFTTGLRQGERLGLTMDELTTLNGRRALVIDHQLQRIPDSRKADWPLGEDVTSLGNGFWLCPPKTDSGERIVVLDDVMCGALDEWLAIRKKKRRGLPHAVRHRPWHVHRQANRVLPLGQGAAANRHRERRGRRQAQAALREAHGGHALRQRRRAGESPARADGPQRRRDDNVYLHADTEALLKVSEDATGAPGLND